jgi:hypothetical protein
MTVYVKGSADRHGDDTSLVNDKNQCCITLSKPSTGCVGGCVSYTLTLFEESRATPRLKTRNLQEESNIG